MSEKYCLLCLVIISNLKFLNANIIPLRPFIPSTSTYKPSTLLLPPGFDSQKAPRQPMLYPYAVSSSGTTTRPKLKNILSTTSDWIPVALNVKSDLSLHSTIPTHPVSIFADRISTAGSAHSSPAYKKGPVFESIIYGTWKPDPPLQPVKISNATKQQHDSSSNINGDFVIENERVYNKTINRQHGGFIGNIQQKPSKADRRIFLSSTPSPDEYKSKELMDKISELKLLRKIKKQGRRKIRPIISTTERNSIEKSIKKEETTTPTKENIQHQQSFIKVNSTDPNLMEVAKQINESIEIKYNHKETSTHSIDVMTTANANDEGDNDDDEYNDDEFFSTVPQIDYDDNAEIFPNISATRRSWPTDFMEEPLTTTHANYQPLNKSEEYLFNDSLETDPSEMPLALSALNIPPSLWPKLPGNITKLGKPYEAESSAEEAALCVPITVREQNTMNSKEMVYIERIFCFPMPPSTTTPANNLNNLENPFTGTTFKVSVTTAKVQNIKDFIDAKSKDSHATSIFKTNLYLLTFVLVIYFKIIV